MEISQEENQTNEKKERQTLKNGMEKEEDETNYRHRCSLCTKSYKSKYDLQKHVRGHTGEACYTCGQCSETFRLYSLYKLHMKIHPESKSYICEYCAKQFVTNLCV
jgi:uncharacterized Zn-finger protein